MSCIQIVYGYKLAHAGDDGENPARPWRIDSHGQLHARPEEIWSDEGEAFTQIVVGDSDEALDAFLGQYLSEDYGAKSAARDALGVELATFGYDYSETMLVVTAATRRDDTMIDIGAPSALHLIGADWRAKLDHVVAGLGLETIGEPQWYAIATFEGR